MASRNPNPARRHEWHAPDGQVYLLEDAPKDFTLYIPPPSLEARACAKALDPNHCALAEQWMLTGGVPVAQFGTDKCYVPIRENGVIKVYRMKVRRKADKARIDAFDRTGIWPDDEGVWLGGIPPSESLDSRRSQSKRLRERWATINHQPRKPLVHTYLRDASRRAQVHIHAAD